METYSVTFTVYGIPDDQYEEYVSEMEVNLKQYGFDVDAGVGQPE